MNTIETIQAILHTYYSVFDARLGKPALLDNILASDWKVYSNNTDYVEKPVFLGMLAGTLQAVPDLHWHICELLIAGDRVVVRGEGKGTPVGTFLGVPQSGKSFTIMGIDIHTIRDGRIQTSYHLEDWASALRQISEP